MSTSRTVFCQESLLPEIIPTQNPVEPYVPQFATKKLPALLRVKATDLLKFLEKKGEMVKRNR